MGSVVFASSTLNKTMKIKLKSPVSTTEGVILGGTVVDWPETAARNYIANGWATEEKKSDKESKLEAAAVKLANSHAVSHSVIEHADHKPVTEKAVVVTAPEVKAKAK